ncbi:MAG: hypothetical protein Ct9H300mP1_25040 [Planctomycetaceae bacterium]|nr:MAG: hypothetical protein Ct9H300mP1_25040 [Planctomycetaceae bacterium]
MTTRADISLLNLILMRLRKVNPTVIVRSKIMATQAQLSKVFSISRQQLEAHYRARRQCAERDSRSGCVQPCPFESRLRHRPCKFIWPGVSARCGPHQCYPKVIDCPDPSKTSGTLDARAPATASS